MWYVGEGQDRVVYSDHEVKGVCEKGQRLLREVPDPGRFEKTLSLAKNGVVYYIDHIPIGEFIRGKFRLDDEVYRFFPRASVLEMRRFVLAHIRPDQEERPV